MVSELAANAMARLRHDLDCYKPDKPFIAYALAGETHAIIIQEWRATHPAIFTKMLVALLDETVTLARSLQSETARFGPTNSFMYGLQDELIRLETQTDIVNEEIRRIEAEIRRQYRGQSVQ